MNPETLGLGLEPDWSISKVISKAKQGNKYCFRCDIMT